MPEFHSCGHGSFSDKAEEYDALVSASPGLDSRRVGSQAGTEWHLGVTRSEADKAHRGRKTGLAGIRCRSPRDFHV